MGRARAGGPPDTFVGDRTTGWIRGHLVNGRRHGCGDTWRNLVPPTAVADPHHAPVEQYIDDCLDACRRYEQQAQRDRWYGAYSCVRASNHPLSDPSESDDAHLYAHAPEFIRIDWRAVRIDKPDDRTPPQALKNMHSDPIRPVASFPPHLRLPALPTPMHGHPALPAGNVTDGELPADLPADFPGAQDNQFDGWFEIHKIVED